MFNALKSILSAALESQENRDSQSRDSQSKEKMAKNVSRKRNRRRKPQAVPEETMTRAVPREKSTIKVAQSYETLRKNAKQSKKLSTLQKAYVYSEIFGKPKGL